MDKKIIYIIYFTSIFFVVSCAKNEVKSSKTESVAVEKEIIEEVDDIETIKNVSDELEKEIVLDKEEGEKIIELKNENIGFLKTGKQSIVLNKLTEGFELYKLLSDSKIEESFKVGIKSDLKLLFDNSKWESLQGNIKNFKLITTENGIIKGHFQVEDKKYYTRVTIKTSKHKIEGIEKESIKIYFSDLTQGE